MPNLHSFRTEEPEDKLFRRVTIMQKKLVYG